MHVLRLSVDVAPNARSDFRTLMRFSESVFQAMRDRFCSLSLVNQVLTLPIAGIEDRQLLNGVLIGAAWA